MFKIVNGSKVQECESSKKKKHKKLILIDSKIQSLKK